MGKKGDLLRLAKKQSAHYTFTGEELEKHDRQVIIDWQAKAFPMLAKRAEEANAAFRDDTIRDIDEHWKRRAAEFKSGNWEEDSTNLMSYVLCMCCRVLIEQFGWKPPNKKGRHTKVMKYAEALVAEIGYISKSSKYDIVAYAKETDKLYGLRFAPDDVTEEE